VEHAEPGTDPTLIETPLRARSSGAEFLRRNWWIVLAVVVLIVLPRLTGDREKPQDAPKPQETAVIAQAPQESVSGLPAGWCAGPLAGYEDQIQAGRRYEPGIYVVGNDFREVRCADAAWFLVDEP